MTKKRKLKIGDYPYQAASPSPTLPPLKTMYKKYTPYIQLAANIFEMFNNIPEKKNFFHYFELACKVKLTYDDFKRNLLISTTSEFNREFNNLVRINGYDLSDQIIYDVMIKNKQCKLIRTLICEEVELKYYKFKNIIFAARFNEKSLSSLFIEKELAKNKGQIYDLVSHEIWKQFNSQMLTYDKENLKFVEDIIENTFIENKKAINFAEDLKIYLKDNVTRSILFYGPPGSGKTNFMRNIAKHLNLKTLRLSLKDLSEDFVLVLVAIFKPDVVIIDDLDHAMDYDLDTILSNIEDINKLVKLLLASANVVSSLNPSLQRPGRFDELIKIDKLDETTHRKLINQDEELYQFTKDFPVVYIVEIMKRVKYKGKDYALNNSQDVVLRVQNLNSFNYEIGLAKEK